MLDYLTMMAQTSMVTRGLDGDGECQSHFVCMARLLDELSEGLLSVDKRGATEIGELGERVRSLHRNYISNVDSMLEVLLSWQLAGFPPSGQSTFIEASESVRTNLNEIIALCSEIVDSASPISVGGFDGAWRAVLAEAGEFAAAAGQCLGDILTIVVDTVEA